MPAIVAPPRPARARAREHRARAFKAALELGVDGVELDVRTHPRWRLRVHHDPSVGELFIAECTASQLPSYVPTLDARSTRFEV